jgi:hypothetical protein
VNELIKELAEQSGVREDLVDNLKDEVEVLTYIARPQDIQKFAELIVRECINIGDNYEDILGNEPECFNCRKVAYGIVDKIKRHFGVEE